MASDLETRVLNLERLCAGLMANMLMAVVATHGMPNPPFIGPAEAGKLKASFDRLQASIMVSQAPVEMASQWVKEHVADLGLDKV